MQLNRENGIKPLHWLLLEIKQPDKTTVKILSGFAGGYLEGDSWRLSTDVEKIEDNDNEYIVTTKSGSTYLLLKKNIGVSGPSAGMLQRIKKYFDVKIIDEDNLKHLK